MPQPPKPRKVHLLEPNGGGFSFPDHANTVRGDGAGTTDINAVTCRVCRFRYLSRQASWAKDFLLDLRAADPKAKTSEGARRRPGCRCKHDTATYGHMKPCRYSPDLMDHSAD